MHEGGIAVLGEEGLKELDYKDLQKGKQLNETASKGFVGITDKYWASVLIPPKYEPFTAQLKASPH